MADEDQATTPRDTAKQILADAGFPAKTSNAAPESTPDAAPAPESTPAPESAPADPHVDALAGIEKKLADARALRQQQDAERQQTQTKSQAELALEQARRELEAERELLRSSPVEYADKYGVDKKALLDTLIKQGATPEVFDVDRKIGSKTSALEAQLKEQAEHIAQLRGVLEQQAQARTYEEKVREFRDHTSKAEAFPHLSRLSAQARDEWGNMAAQQFISAQVPFSLDEAAVLAERLLRERKAQLLGEDTAAPAQTPRSSATPTKPAPGITADLAAHPAGQIKPPQTDEERRAAAKRILDAD